MVCKSQALTSLCECVYQKKRTNAPGGGEQNHIFQDRRQVCSCVCAWISHYQIHFPTLPPNYRQQKNNLEKFFQSLLFPSVLLLAFSSILPTCSFPPPLSLSLSLSLSLYLFVFCVMEWLLRTWLLCLTLVDEVCLCLSVLTCRKRDTAYSKINTQSRRWREREREREKG